MQQTSGREHGPHFATEKCANATPDMLRRNRKTIARRYAGLVAEGGKPLFSTALRVRQCTIHAGKKMLTLC
ncbi:hypothetical protein GPA22_11120 [Aromatoleum toluvorans]|uniref:Transposase n=1 Tax=Aromatoleum toluvorans TaxID=92002 RepID=A0ABX1PY37_9RHOO|nr:hypothetical protein [Aromatoleum toluvorans]NMG44278.1 hypothetical protein [Aromatoleum toluvorans]